MSELTNEGIINYLESLHDVMSHSAAAAIRDLRAERDALRQDAAIGRVVWRFIDRMNDICEQDTADEILSEFVVAVQPLIDAALAAQERKL
jgi:hypothetical protein